MSQFKYNAIFLTTRKTEKITERRIFFPGLLKWKKILGAGSKEFLMGFLYELTFARNSHVMAVMHYKSV
jgi:hypothetical protein